MIVMKYEGQNQITLYLLRYKLHDRLHPELSWMLVIYYLPFCAVAGLFLHPPLVYSEFLKRNEDALLICVVGGRQTPTTACYFIFTEHLQWRKQPYNFNIIIGGKTQGNRGAVHLVTENLEFAS
jgi:hypothetical protein